MAESIKIPDFDQIVARLKSINLNMIMKNMEYSKVKQSPALLVISTIFLVFAIGWVSWTVQSAIKNLYFSKLTKFPGPRLAAATDAWRAWVECFVRESFAHKLETIHAKYGEVVRVGPNELHFSNPQAYHDIYNNYNRWDKDFKLYHSFNEDESSFGFVTYKEAKERKDVLNKMFSSKAIMQAEDLIVDKINDFCGVLNRLSKHGQLADLNWGFRCLAMDIVTSLCFGKSVDAMQEPQFKAPIIVAMDASMPIFARFKHFEWYKNMIMNCPPNISKVVSPETAGLVELQQILNKQIADLTNNPDNLSKLPHNMTIYHHLMDKEAYRNGVVPSAKSLYHEAQALMFAGSDTSGNTLFVAAYHLIKNPTYLQELKTELLEVWPSLSEVPTYRDLERLPYLNAVLKEALRLNGGVVSGLLRVVPQQGAKISGVDVPGGTIVSCGCTFVHYNEEIFPNPEEFNPDRWLDDPSLDQWLVPFSRGPRMCLGINLAWLEMRLILAHVFRRFDMKLDPSSPEKLVFKDTFLPFYLGPHAKAKVTPVSA